MKKRISIFLILVMFSFSFSIFTVSAEEFCVAKIGDVEYMSFEAAINAAGEGDTVTIVKEGTYELPDAISNNIKIIAETDVQVNCTQEGNVCSAPNGCTFENVTLILALSSYHGFQHSGKIIMNSCTIKGLLQGYNDMEFNNCIFYAPGTLESGVETVEYAMWTYAGNITYNNCEFFSKGKCMHLYNEGYPRTEMHFNGCTFHSTVKNKAAINIKETVVQYNRLLDFDVYIDANCKIADDSLNYFPTSADSTDACKVLDPLVQVDDISLDKEAVSKSDNPGVVVQLKGKTVYSSFPVEEPEEPEEKPQPRPIPQPEPKEEYVSPDDTEGAIDFNADIVDNTAAVKEISKEELDEFTNSQSSDKKNQDTIVIDLSQAQQEVKAVELTKSTIQNLADVTASQENDLSTVSIVLSNASIEIDAKTLETLSAEAQGDSIQLVVDNTQTSDLNASQQATLDGMAVSMIFEAYFESNGEKIHDFNGGTVTVKIKFEPENGKKASNYKVYYIKDSGEAVKYATKYSNGLLKFVTTHFSDYAIVYDTAKEVLLLKAKASGKKTVELSWNGLANAAKYEIYGAKCGDDFKKLKSIKGKSFTVKKIAGKILKAHQAYKFYVIGYDTAGNKVRSRTIHFITANTHGKYANVKSIKAKVDTLLLGIGRTHKLGATYKMYDSKKHIRDLHGCTLKYFSNNTGVATVNSNGTVKAVGKGTATIYIQDIGGRYCKTKVTVE